MRFEVLGPLRVFLDGDDVTPRGRLQRLLLSTLLAHANAPVSVDALCETLWGQDVDDRSAARLQLLVHRLRGSLDEQDRVLHGPLGYSIRIDSGELDADRFDLLVEHLTDGQDPQDLVRIAREALVMWRGLPFQDVDDPSLQSQGNRWVERRLVLLSRLFEADLEAGRHAESVAEIDDAARLHPLNERMQALLMTALYRSGRQSEALEVYRRTRSLLVDELGVEPGADLQELHERVLAGEDDDRAAIPAPAQLPQGVAQLTGRDTDLAAMDKVLAPSGAKEGHSRLCVVTGTAGVGKTALAVHWAHRHREEFPDGQLFFDLRGYSTDEPATPDRVLTAFIRAMGGEVNALSQDVEEQAALFRTLVTGKRLLIVLDNARSAEQIRPLLPGASGCLVVVTSRESLPGLAVRDGAQALSLDRLDPHEALSLLAHHAGDRVCADIELGRRLVEHCACLPLALRIMAEQIRMRPGRDLAALLVELTGERERLDLLDMGDGPSTDVRAVFSWSYESLADDARRLFRYLGLLPGADADVETIAAMYDSDVRETQQLLGQLVRAHLVDNDLGLRYCQHDLLRTYASELAVATDANDVRADVMSRLIDYYSHAASVAGKLVTPPEQFRLPELEPRQWAHPRLDDRESALRWFDLERSAIVASTRVAGERDGRQVITLSRMLGFYLRLEGYVADSYQLHTAALREAQRLGDKADEAQAESVLGMLDGSRGDLESSRAHFTRTLKISRELGDRVGEASALANKAAIDNMRGELPGAVQLFQRALEIDRLTGDDGRAALALANIGESLCRLGRHAEAFENLEAARKLALKGEFGWTLGFILYALAEVHAATDDLESALRCGREALDVIGSSGGRIMEGQALRVMGRIHLQGGETGLALDSYESALHIGRESGDCVLISEALEGIGLVQASSDLSAAKTYFEEAVTLASKHGLVDREVRYREELAGIRAEIDHA